MKRKLISLSISMLLAIAGFAQSPQALSYQALLRDGANQIIANSAVSTQISILQGAVDGTAVYVETHDLTTNANGLISTQIGHGTLVSGTFDAIDWANGPFFIKTETDPDGGTNYTIENTSQVLSVPYALHSNRASLADTATFASKADTANIALLAEMLSGGISAEYILDLNQRLMQLEPDPQIGDYRYGGIVFWIDPLNPKHGMVISIENLAENTKVNWSAGANQVTGATSEAFGEGYANTEKIIAAHGEGNYAAWICHTYKKGIYDNWALPSVDECAEVYKNIALINEACVANGGIAISSQVFWTSCESGKDYAKTKYMTSTGGGGGVKVGYPHRVRAIRAF